jgi:pimeloyl-ACP methyl ester carboxylesterase
MNSELADTFRLVAMDMLGVMGSRTSLATNTAIQSCGADDVHAVIEALQLDRPVLCGWSYGPLVILDYIRHYGENSIRGLNFVGGVTKLGSDEAASQFWALTFSSSCQASFPRMRRRASALSTRWCACASPATLPPKTVI